MERFNTVNDIVKYLKKMTNQNLTCSLGLGDFKSYVDICLDEYIDSGDARYFKAANYTGLVDRKTLVFSEQVGSAH